MRVNFESIPGFNKDERHSYIYVQAGDFLSFRKFFAGIQIMLGAPRPKSGSLMNDEVQLVTPSGEVYCAICITGDHEAWRKVVETYSKSVGVKTACVQDQDLAISDGERVSLSLCRLESSHGR